MSTATLKPNNQFQEQVSETVRVTKQTLREDCYDSNLVYCGTCGIGMTGDATQDRTCKDCMDQAILGFDDYKLV